MDCDDDCYTLSLNDLYPLQSVSEVWCYEYKLELNTSCTFEGDIRLLFGVDDEECYLSRMEFEESLLSVDPSQYLVYQQPVGVEVIANPPTDLVTLCIDGTDERLSSHSVRISDNEDHCEFIFDDAPDFCS